MVGVIVRIIMSLAAVVTGWFVATTDSARFDVVQMVVALFLIALFVFIAAFWSTIVGWFETKRT